MAGKKEEISTSFLKQLGRQVYSLRKAAGLSMEELGLEVGLSKIHIHRIENGYNITMITLLKISLAFDMKLAELLDFKYPADKETLEQLVNNNKSYRFDLKKSKNKRK